MEEDRLHVRVFFQTELCVGGNGLYRVTDHPGFPRGTGPAI